MPQNDQTLLEKTVADQKEYPQTAFQTTSSSWQAFSSSPSPAAARIRFADYPGVDKPRPSWQKQALPSGMPLQKLKNYALLSSFYIFIFSFLSKVHTHINIERTEGIIG